MFKPLSDFNVTEISKAETSASTPVSSRLPVILLRKPGHMPSTKYGLTTMTKSSISLLLIPGTFSYTSPLLLFDKEEFLSLELSERSLS